MNLAIPDIPREYTAIAEWFACLLYIMLLRKRVSGWKIAVIAPVALVLQIFFLIWSGSFPLLLWIPSMVAAILIMFAFIYACCDISLIDAGYFSIRAFILAELSASLEAQVYWFFWPEDTASFVVRALLLAGTYITVGTVVWFLEKRYMVENARMSIELHEFWNAFMIGAVIFFVSNLSFVFADTPFSGLSSRDVLNTRTLFDLGGFAILYAYHIQCCQMRSRRDLEAIQNVLKNQYLQYKQSKESIELINRKYHDLKHQIAALRAEQDPSKRNEWLDAMEDDIKIYEAQNKTGHSVLDTLLTSKSMLCNRHDIHLTCVADGALLQFMDVMDICTIFGNALDNAIECELQIPDKDKRLIHLSVSKQREFLLMKFENYYEGQLSYEQDLPLTTKRDANYHGYGLKNIRFTAQKYGGEATVTAENNWFELKVIIPI